VAQAHPAPPTTLVVAVVVQAGSFCKSAMRSSQALPSTLPGALLVPQAAAPVLPALQVRTVS
jgi:hypothetical protein